MTINWTNGNGSRRIAKINTTNSFTAPANGSDYVASSVYANAGEQVIYNGTGSSVTVTGLAPFTFYWFRIYEASCSSSNSVYLTSTASNNPKRRKTQHASPQNNPNRPEDAVDAEEPEPVQIYPNPTTNSITVESGSANLLSAIIIYSTDGRKLREETLSAKSGKAELNLSELAAGVYFLDCIGEKGREMVKLVKY